MYSDAIKSVKYFNHFFTHEIAISILAIIWCKVINIHLIMDQINCYILYICLFDM